MHIGTTRNRRFTEIETRRGRAHYQGWIGKVESIDLTLTFLLSNGSDAHWLATRTAVWDPCRSANDGTGVFALTSG